MTSIVFSYSCIQNVVHSLLKYEVMNQQKKNCEAKIVLWFCFCNALNTTICHRWHVQQQVATVGSDSALSSTYITVSHYSFRAVQTGMIPKIMK